MAFIFIFFVFYICCYSLLKVFNMSCMLFTFELKAIKGVFVVEVRMDVKRFALHIHITPLSFLLKLHGNYQAIRN